jgi:uncharacterized protein YeaO (DUF488 family)
MGSTPHVRVGRVYDQRSDADGLRVLVDRIWPRGLTKVAVDLDDWCKAIAPSTALRRWYVCDPERYDEFARRYRVELQEPERAEALARLRHHAEQRTVTLLTATKRPEISGAAVLVEILEGQPGR